MNRWADRYTYDANGSLTSDGNRCFAYDDENQLISVWVTNVWRTDFVYDGKMRRRIRREYVWQSGIWNLQSEIHYVYDGNLVIQERDGNNNPLVTYTRGVDLSGSLEGAGGIGGLLALSQSSDYNLQHFYYHADGNGNITCMLDAAQAVVAWYLYDPYGRLLGQRGSLSDANLYRFSSKEFHATSALYYYGYRFYDPNLQRWLNRDPSGKDSSVELYRFAANNPVCRVDLLGLVSVAAPTDGCGPDVTSALTATLAEVENTFRSWSLPKKYVACMAIITPPWAVDAWDVTPLYDLGLTGMFEFTAPAKPGTGKCAKTVAYMGGCYDASALNFVLYGKMNSLCAREFWFAGLPSPFGNPWSLLGSEVRVEIWKLVRYGGSQLGEAVG